MNKKIFIMSNFNAFLYLILAQKRGENFYYKIIILYLFLLYTTLRYLKNICVHKNILNIRSKTFCDCTNS